MKDIIKQAARHYVSRNEKRHYMNSDIEDAFIKGVEVSNNLVDSFLKEHPEYRCLDVIGKFSDWKIKRKLK